MSVCANEKKSEKMRIGFHRHRQITYQFAGTVKKMNQKLVWKMNNMEIDEFIESTQKSSQLPCNPLV